MSSPSQFAKLLEPGRIGSMVTRNRIIMAPMGSGYATEEGLVTNRLKDYYEERAKGGVGLIICGVVSVDAPMGRCEETQIAISQDAHIAGLSELTEAVHRHGAKIAAQLQHAGKVAVDDWAKGFPMLTPSGDAVEGAKAMADMSSEEKAKYAKFFANAPASKGTKAATIEEIQRLVGRFAEAAERSKRSGFDGVEIHAAHGYLLSAFLSPASNQRQDQYGGDLKNRARFVLEIIQATRKRVGKDYPVWCRIDAREFGIEGGITPEDGRALAVMLRDAGVDAIHVTGWGGVTRGFIDAPVCYKPGHLVSYAADIKAAVRIPVIAVGRISPELGENLLREGKADFIAMGRALLVDPELPKKLTLGQREAVRPCIGCYRCISEHIFYQPTVCSVNTATGRESDFRMKPATKAKKVLVVGGGPAGMEAARIAALRGHHVAIYEKNRRLGGSLVFASVVSADNENLLNWMTRQMKTLNIDVRLGETITPEAIQHLRPDVTVIAVGPAISPPPIPGSDRRNVMSGKDLREMMNGRDISGKLPWWMKIGLPVVKPTLQRMKPSMAAAVTRRWLPVIGRNVVVIGGDLVAIELAEFLVERGRKVTIVSTLPSMAPDMALARRQRVLGSLREHGVTMINKVTYEQIDGQGVVFVDKKGEKHTAKADTVVIAEGIGTNTQLFRALEGKLPECYQAGDCAEVRLIEGAIETGTRVGLKI